MFDFLGIHPHNAHSFDERDVERLKVLLKKPGCVGIGEVGLDFNRNFSPKNKQLECFEKQVVTGNSKRMGFITTRL